MRVEDGAGVEAALRSPRVRGCAGRRRRAGGGGEAGGGEAGGGGGGPLLLEVNRAWDAHHAGRRSGRGVEAVAPKPILGTAFGWAQASSAVGEEAAAAMVRAFVAAGGEEEHGADVRRGADQAHPREGGGGAAVGAGAALRVATKANPAGEAGDGGTGELGAARLAGVLGHPSWLRVPPRHSQTRHSTCWPDTATGLQYSAR